jgi:hypothetical protein
MLGALVNEIPWLMKKKLQLLRCEWQTELLETEAHKFKQMRYEILVKRGQWMILAKLFDAK